VHEQAIRKAVDISPATPIVATATANTPMFEISPKRLPGRERPTMHGRAWRLCAILALSPTMGIWTGCALDAVSAPSVSTVSIQVISSSGERPSDAHIQKLYKSLEPLLERSGFRIAENPDEAEFVMVGRYSPDETMPSGGTFDVIEFARNRRVRGKREVGPHSSMLRQVRELEGQIQALTGESPNSISP